MALVVFFAIPLWRLVFFAATSEFHSYILLIPFITAFLIWAKREKIMVVNFSPATKLGNILLAAGASVILAYWFVLRCRWDPMEDDYLALIIFAFLLCFWGVCYLFWGRDTLRVVTFPLGLLIFVVPIPTFAMSPIEAFLQNGSAAVARIFFSLSGTPFLQNGLTFQLPDISIQIAPECSGIQSSLVLLITSLLAGYLFLRTPWKRALLTLLVIPLALVRNGFRVFVIGELCVHIGPQMINSYIHRKGGPIFFVMSLIPFFLLLIFFQRSEKSWRKSGSKEPETNRV